MSDTEAECTVRLAALMPGDLIRYDDPVTHVGLAEMARLISPELCLRRTLLGWQVRLRTTVN